MVKQWIIMPARFTTPTGDFQLLPHKGEHPRYPVGILKEVLVSQIWKLGVSCFPHPAFVKQGNKRAVIPTHTGATPGHSWSEAHRRCEQHSRPSLPVYSSLYLANEMETYSRHLEYIQGIYRAGNYFQKCQFIFNFSSLSSEWSGLKLSLAVI